MTAEEKKYQENLIAEKNNSQNELKRLKSDLEKFKGILTCKVCNTVPNGFNYVQSKCEHVFCGDCTRKALLSEEKKCPIPECDKILEKSSMFKIKISDN